MPPHTVRTTTVQAAHQRKEPVERGGGAANSTGPCYRPSRDQSPYHSTRRARTILNKSRYPE
jgi:hypothetical protein